MKKFDNILRKFDLHYFGNGNHKISFEKMMKLFKEGRAFIIDVRTRLENEHLRFNFAKNIPIDEIPDSIDKIPKDKTIVLFCSSSTRVTIVYAYLLLLDYDVRILVDKISEIASNFKPGYMLKNLEPLGKRYDR